MRVYVVIPAYNEEGRVGGVVERAKAFSNSVVVVDDGSVDDTAGEAVRAGATVIRLGENRGVGYATRVGIVYALRRGADVVVTLDADGQHLPEEIPYLLRAIEAGYDVALTYRWFGRKSMPFLRKVLNMGTNFIAWLVTGRVIRDALCGFRAFNRRALASLRFLGAGYSFVPGVAMEVAMSSLRWVEVPVSCVYDVGKKPSYNPVEFAKAFVTYARLFALRLMRKLAEDLE